GCPGCAGEPCTLGHPRVRSLATRLWLGSPLPRFPAVHRRPRSAFYLRSARGERWAGLGVVVAILISAVAALYETIQRLIHPQHLSHLWVLASAGVVGFIGNEIAARVRLRGGKRLDSPALVADGNHARIDAFVSLGVVASAVVVALGARIADPLIGLAITIVILKI